MPAEFLRDAEIQADRLGVADMEIAVRLGRKAGDDWSVAAGREIRADDVADKILPRLANRSFNRRHSRKISTSASGLEATALHEGRAPVQPRSSRARRAAAQESAAPAPAGQGRERRARRTRGHPPSRPAAGRDRRGRNAPGGSLEARRARGSRRSEPGPAAGPSRIATATARFSSITGDGSACRSRS